MSIILKKLKEYDNSVTVGQLICKLEQEEISAKQKETEEIEKVKKDFKDVYLKRIFDCDLFGDTLQIFHIEEITNTSKTTQYKTIYYFKGSRLSFDKTGTNKIEIFGNDSYHTFSFEDLNDMVVIGKKEYVDYIQHHEQITESLNSLIKL